MSYEPFKSTSSPPRNWKPINAIDSWLSNHEERGILLRKDASLDGIYLGSTVKDVLLCRASVERSTPVLSPGCPRPNEEYSLLLQVVNPAFYTSPISPAFTIDRWEGIYDEHSEGQAHPAWVAWPTDWTLLFRESHAILAQLFAAAARREHELDSTTCFAESLRIWAINLAVSTDPRLNAAVSRAFNA